MRALSLLGRALLVYAVAVALRLRDLKEVLVGDRVLFGFDDPYYHLRRVLLTLQNFPFVPAFDSYTNFPAGARITWPPGFDLLVSTVCWLAGGGHPSVHRAEATAALLIPFLGGITAVVVLLLGEEIFGRARWEAFTAAVLFALLPAQQAISSVGRLDHHVMEMIAFSCAILFFLRAARDDRGSRWSFWGGFSLAAGVFCWTGAILYAGFLTAFVIVEMILDRSCGRPESGGARSALRVLFWGALLLVPLMLVSPGDGKESFTFLYLSWYQPALLAVAALLVPALSEVIFAPGGKWRILRVSGGGLAAATLVAIGGWIIARGSGGIDFLTRRDPVIALLVESQPWYRLPSGTLLLYFSYLLFLAPVAGVLLLRMVIRDRFGDMRLNCLLFLFLFTAALGAAQARFLNYFAVPFCLTLLWAFRRWLERLRRKFSSRPLRWFALSATSLVLLVPLGPTLRDSFRPLPTHITPALAYLYPSLEWMRDRTPRTSRYMEPDKTPEYGVLSDFSYGHWVTAIGERPNFANPFSLAPWHEKPIQESARMFLMEEERPLVAQLDERRLRYVILFNQENAIEDYAGLLEVPVAQYQAVAPDGKRIPTPRFFRTFGVHLALADGSEYRAAGETITALSGFRMVHESPETHRRVIAGLESPLMVSRVKIFERVRGAVIHGATRPGATITLKMAVTTNTGRHFDYVAHRTAGPDGLFALTIPYATEMATEITAGPAQIETPECRREVAVAESDVMEGTRRPIPPC